MLLSVKTHKNPGENRENIIFIFHEVVFFGCVFFVFSRLLLLFKGDIDFNRFQKG